MNLTSEQKKKLIELAVAVLITVILGVATILGYQVVLPMPIPTPVG